MTAETIAARPIAAESSCFSSAADCEFVLSVERGKLEAQAVLLLESLRRFGGAYANCPVYAVSPRPARQIGARCRAALQAQGAELIVVQLLAEDERYGSAARLAACAWAERCLTAKVLVSLDDDMFFAAEPDFSMSGCDLLARPVDVKGMCTTGSADSFDPYWRRIASRCDVDYDAIPWIQTTVDGMTVKASYNGGMVAVRRELGVFQTAQQMLQVLQASAVAPRRFGWRQVIASTGYVGTTATRWWGVAQAVLSLAATQLGAVVRIAPPTYNVPVHLLDKASRLGSCINLGDVVLVHYHGLLYGPRATRNALLGAHSTLRADVLDWLRTLVPLPEDLQSMKGLAWQGGVQRYNSAKVAAATPSWPVAAPKPAARDPDLHRNDAPSASSGCGASR